LRRGGGVTPVGLRPPFVTPPPPSLILIDAESHLVCRRAKNARNYVERGLEAPKYGQRKHTMFGDRLATYLRERVKACPVRTARRLFREI